jgi:hypothetical protein
MHQYQAAIAPSAPAMAPPSQSGWLNRRRGRRDHGRFRGYGRRALSGFRQSGWCGLGNWRFGRRNVLREF